MCYKVMCCVAGDCWCRGNWPALTQMLCEANMVERAEFPHLHRTDCSKCEESCGGGGRNSVGGKIAPTNLGHKTSTVRGLGSLGRVYKKGLDR